MLQNTDPLRSAVLIYSTFQYAW